MLLGPGRMAWPGAAERAQAAQSRIKMMCGGNAAAAAVVVHSVVVARRVGAAAAIATAPNSHRQQLRMATQALPGHRGSASSGASSSSGGGGAADAAAAHHHNHHHAQPQPQLPHSAAPAPPLSAPRRAAPPAAAAAPASAVEAPPAVAAAPPMTAPATVEFLGVLGGMHTVKGVLDVAAPADLVYSILTDYDRCAEVFANISASETVDRADGGKTVVQACTWRFLAFSGSFSVALGVEEDAAARALVFRLEKSTFMRDFEGRWQVEPLDEDGGYGYDGSSSSGSDGSGAQPRARVSHVLAVKPLMPIPPAVARYTAGIFTRQVEGILGDLRREIEARAAAGAN